MSQGWYNDFYYLYVGLEKPNQRPQQPTQNWRLGRRTTLTNMTVPGYSIDFEESALISSIELRNDKLGVSLHFHRLH